MPKSKEFVSSSGSDDSGSDSEPKQKKKKVEEKKKKPEKKEAAKGSDGERMFQLSKMRYATVSEFRGKVFVGIREYYDKDGDLRPGKKGISLNMEQWNKLKDHIDDIDEALKEF